MGGDQDRVLPGNAAASETDKPWTGLQSFGVEFLNRFEVSECNSPVLQEVTFIDTPGVLSGEKQRLQRGYDFVKVKSLLIFFSNSHVLILCFSDLQMVC